MGKERIDRRLRTRLMVEEEEGNREDRRWGKARV